MPGNPNPSLSLVVNYQGLAPAPAGGGNTPLVIGWTQSGPWSGAPGNGPVAVSNIQTLTGTYGSYGNAVDAAALDLAAGANEVLIYKAFAGTVNSGNWTRTGTGTGTIAVSGNVPLAPYGTGTSTGSTGVIIQITASSDGTLYGQFNYSLDGGVTWSTPQNIVPTTPQSLGTTGISVIFTGANTVAVWVASDTYVKPITTAVGKMFPYGGSTFAAGLKQTTATGSTTVVGEGTFADNSSNPLDSFNVVIQIVTTGTSSAGTAQYVVSLDGGITFGSVQTMPAASAAITLPGGMSLTPADTGGPGGTIAGFQAGELYKFSTLGPQLTVQNVLAIINSLVGNPNTWGWIHVAQQANTVNTSASTGFELDTLFTDVEAGVANLWASGKYVGSWVLIDSPTSSTANNIDATLESWAAGRTGLYTSVGIGGAAATVSTANGWQLPRGSSWDVSSKACSAPIGQDLAWVGSGPLVGISQLYRNEANTPGLGPSGFCPLTTIPGASGFYIANANLLVASNNDISLAQYRRIINAGCQAAQGALVNYLSSSVRLTATGKIDPRDIAIIENVTRQAVLSALNGQVSGADVSVSNTLGAGGELFVTVSITPFGYAKAISVTVGFINPALQAQAA